MSTLSAPVAAIAEISRVGDEHQGAWLREYEGYRGTLVLVEAGAQTARLITLWESAADEERSRSSRGAMRDEPATTAGMDVVDFGVFEVPAWEILSRA